MRAAFATLAIMLAVLAGCAAYPSLPAGIADCGSEKFRLGTGTDRAIRECFMNAFWACTPAKIVLKEQAFEPGVVTTTAVVEPQEGSRCRIHLYVDNSRSGGRDDQRCEGAQLSEERVPDEFLEFEKGGWEKMLISGDVKTVRQNRTYLSFYGCEEQSSGVRLET